jgi:hypothetical protein
MSGYLSELAGRTGYLVLAAALILSQHLLAWALGAPSTNGSLFLPEPVQFWLAPLRSVLELPGLPDWQAGLAFAYCLAVAGALAALSFRRARHSVLGNTPAVLSVVPVLQVLAILALALAPSRPAVRPKPDDESPTGGEARSVVFGLIAGIAIVVLAVLVSAVTFGAYGWGLFVMTPLLVGLTTGYLVNQNRDIGAGETMVLVNGAAALGSLALVVLALEGIICILMAAPLAIPVTMVGGAIGRWIAVSRLKCRNPLASVAVLPLIFVIEAMVPPEATIATARAVEIDAPPGAVWAALTSAEPIAVEPGLTALAGLAYPLAGRLGGEGEGAVRIGTFSTGEAVEEVSEWRPGRALAFRVVSQPPAMEEMSPYRRVHAPHVVGYFETGETRFDLMPLPNGGTRLSIAAEHRLRIDPVPYWAPIARFAIRDNVDRVLRDVAAKAERFESLGQPAGPHRATRQQQ